MIYRSGRVEKAGKERTAKTGTEADGLAKVVNKSRRQIWWNWFRARLPVLFLLGLLLSPVHPVWRLWGLPLLLFGQGLRAWAAGYIHKDRHLTTTGPYAFCRNPLYLGTFLSMVGICLLIGSWQAGVIFTLIFIAVYIPTIRQEETFMASAYGESYNEYKSKVPAFFPKIRMAKAEDFRNWSWQRLLLNEEHLTWAALVIFFSLALWLKR